MRRWEVNTSHSLALLSILFVHISSTHPCNSRKWSSYTRQMVCKRELMKQCFRLRYPAEEWEVPLWGLDPSDLGLLIFDEPPFMCLTPTDFISKFTDLLTPSFMFELAFFKLCLHVPGETARSNWTFTSSMASWNLWMPSEMSGFLIASSTNARNSRCASLALPN